MGILVRQGGVWAESDPSVRQSGVWSPVDKGYNRVAGVWQENYSAYTPAVAPAGPSCVTSIGVSAVSFIGNWSAWYSMAYRTVVSPNVATPMQTIRNDGQDGSVQVTLRLEQEWASFGPDDEGDSWGVESIWRRPCSTLTDTQAAQTASNDGPQQSAGCRTYTINAGCNIRGHQIVRSYYRHSPPSGNLNVRFRTRMDMRTVDPYEDWTKI